MYKNEIFSKNKYICAFLKNDNILKRYVHDNGIWIIKLLNIIQ